MKNIKKLFLLVAVVFVAASCKDKYPDLKDGIYAEIVTSKGTMVAELNYKEAPLTVANFIALAEGTHPKVADSLKKKPYYNGVIFHRVIEEFMIQTGDRTGTGSGDTGYTFAQEISENLKHDSKGVLSMANAGPNTNGSQFFITQKETPFLDGRYNIFGKVVMGLEVIDSIAKVKKNGEKPVDDVKIETVNIYRKGSEAKKFDAPKKYTTLVAAAEKKAEDEIKEMQELQTKSADAIVAKEKELVTLKEKATELPSGVKVYTISKGTGEKPAIGSVVSIYYTGFFTSGRVFDSTDKKEAVLYGGYVQQKDAQGAYGMPLDIQYDPNVQMIPGFKEAMLTMNYGDEILAFIPAKEAYGAEGAGGGFIPPNADLIFKLKIGPKKAEPAK